ncbi:hypothetical protein, partial [Thermodesulfovibrio yellowstonii]
KQAMLLTGVASVKNVPKTILRV